MPYARNSELPPAVRDRYSERCQTVFRRTFNEWDGDEPTKFKVAHTAAKNCEQATDKSKRSPLAMSATKELSFNERSQAVQAALQKARGSDRLYVVDLYEDRAVYEEYAESPGRMWEVPYTITDDGDVTLGDRIEVEREVTYRTVKSAVKFAEGSDTIIEGYGVPFGRDLDAQQFTAKTDRCHDWFPKGGRPVLYHHGFHDGVKFEAVGHELSTEPRDDGDFVRAELDKAHKYYEKIATLVRKGALGWSSGAPDHKVKIAADGTIERWPVIEYSLTPTPAFPNRVSYAVKTADALEHLAAVDAEIPEPLSAAAINEQSTGDPEPESLADQSERVVAGLKAWAERMEERSDFRVKYGRELSKANIESLREAHKLIGALLERADAEARSDEDASKAFADWLKLETELAGI